MKTRVRLKCIYCGRILDYGRKDFQPCPKHLAVDRQHRVWTRVTLGGSYPCEYMEWPHWMPAWRWVRRTLLWPLFDNEVLSRAGKIMGKQLQEKYKREDSN